jgi:hypothetical protein
MYFHFASKRDMADAILDTATAVYTQIGQHWVTAEDVRPLDALAGRFWGTRTVRHAHGQNDTAIAHCRRG